MRRTETSKANSRQKSKANGRQKSKANGRQEKNIANGRQSEPKDCDRDKAKYEKKHLTDKSCSQPVPKHPRTDADVQQEPWELKLGEMITTIPKIDFRRGNRGVQGFDEETARKQQTTQTAQKQRSWTLRRILSA